MGKIIELDRSVVPACDVDFETYKKIVDGVKDVDKVRAVKVGFTLGYGEEGLPYVVGYAKDHGLTVIFDHQKAGTDIHESTPQKYMDKMVDAGVDAVILFPESGPAVQYEWTREAQNRGLGVVIGPEMTHPRFLEGDFSNGKKDSQNYTEIFQNLLGRDLTGYLRKDCPEDILELAAKMGVTDFVMPGNKPDRITYFKEHLAKFDVVPVVYSPGLVAQGGDLSDGAKAAGKFHGIVGRGIYKADDVKKAAEELTHKL